MATISDKKVASLAEAMALSSISKLQEEINKSDKLRRDHKYIFYTTIGQGITAWSGMEEVIVQIAAKLLRTSEVKAGLIMYSTINFYVWLQIIDDLFVLDALFHNL